MPKENLTIKQTEKDKYIVLTLAGRIDSDNVQKLREAAIEKIQNNDIVLDMTKLNFITSTGIGNLIEFNDNADKYNNKLILIGVQQNIIQIIKLTGFLDAFTIVDSFDEIK